MAPVTALVVVADGTEEMEAVITIDVLRRAEVQVTVAGLVSADTITCSGGVKLVPDAALSDVIIKSFNVIVLPGGNEGSKAFNKSVMVQDLLKKQAQIDNTNTSQPRHIALICAAPIILPTIGIYPGAAVTCYPSMRDSVIKGNDKSYQYKEDTVVVSGPSANQRLITSRGPGTAIHFAVKIVEVLCGSEAANKVKEPMILGW